MLDIVTEPICEKYNKLIDYAIKNSDAFMFVTCDFDKDINYKQKVIPFVKDLEPYIIKIRHNKIWPGQERLGRQKHNIYLFRMCEEVKEKLLEPNGLYKWRYPNYPEDLSFFRDGRCWLTSIAHEDFSYIYEKDIEEVNKFKEIGIEFEYFNIPEEECEFFYEEYKI